MGQRRSQALDSYCISASEPEPVGAVVLIDSPLESARYGLRVGRAALDINRPSLDMKGLVDLMASSEFDVVVLRVPAASDLAWPDAVGSQVDVLFAGTDMTYEAPVRAGTPDESMTSISEWTKELDLLVRDVFAGYRNHVQVNPRMDQSLVPAGYAEWASSHVGVAERAVFVLAEQDVPVALAAVAFEGGQSVINLAGVASAARRRGVYARLLDGVEQAAHERGCTSLSITTQVDNIPAQRAWARRGWLPISALYTFHLMRRF